MKNNIVLVGGSGLIGAKLSEYLIREDYNVIVIDKKKLKRLHGIDFFNVDITNSILLKKTLNKIFSKYKKIDALINCSYPKNKNWGKKFEKLKPIDLKENLYNHLGSTIILCQLTIRYFLKQKYGNLVLFSSIQGVSAPKFEHYRGTKIISPIEYSAMKAGIINITKYIAKYYKKKNIRINCVSPGGIFADQPNSFVKKYKNSCLSKGLLDGNDLCGTVHFLISDKSKYVNGQNIVVDDGWSL